MVEWWDSERRGGDATPTDLANYSFDSGRFRECYKGRYLRGKNRGKPLVCKIFKGEYRSAEKEHHSANLTIYYKTLEVVDRWNKQHWTKKIWVNQHCLRGGVTVAGEANMTVQAERWIPNFVKYNSNSGWVRSEDPSGTWEDVAQALSHYSYHTSNRSVLLCDVQGGASMQTPESTGNMALHSNGLFLTDPAINSQRPGQYGMTDLGPSGIASFFHTHKCNQFCQKNWLWPKAGEFKGSHVLSHKESTSWSFENLQESKVPQSTYVPSFGGIQEDEEEEYYDDDLSSSSDDKWYDYYQDIKRLR
jgi:hypothetical protein